MRVLVAGWFSFEHMGATAGDLMARDVACRWLAEAGCPFDVAAVPPFATAQTVDWRGADPRRYTHVLFVCGPLGNGEPFTSFHQHFAGRRMVGLDLTMLQPLDEWNPFDVLFERDSSRASHPDLAFAAPPPPPPRVPVLGIVLAHPQKEYKQAAMHAAADAALHRLAESREAARLHIDTCLDPWNKTGLRTAGEVEAMIASVDVVLTTRLHGMVLALKNGVPAIVIDPVAGGAKLRRQAETIGWPFIFDADTVTDDALGQAFDRCLTPAARDAARACAASAITRLEEIRRTFVQQMRSENS